MSKRNLPKIILAPHKYRITCSYEEAVLYCFQLEIDGKIGWRLPTQEEYCTEYFASSVCWWHGGKFSNIHKQVVAVRDV